MLTLRTLSKAYGLAGLRVGYAVGDPHVITALRKVAIPFALNSLAQAAALAALAVKDEFAPRWQQVIAERDRVDTRAARLRLSRCRPRRRTSSGCRCASGPRNSPRTPRTTR